MASFDASITGDELDSAVKLPNFRSVVTWRVLYIAQRLALFVHGITSDQPRKHVKFGQRYLSEKVVLSL
jgi:hypothetical protein